MDTSPPWFKSLHCWIYRCEDILLEPLSHRLERGGQAVSVEPKAYAVLTMLMEHPDMLIDKDTLLDAVWGHRNVTYGVLSRVISQLRRALNDSATRPRLIATVYCLGYRFIGEVHREAVPPGSRADSAVTTAADRRRTTDRRTASDRRTNRPQRAR
jgi:DNA-binding winged helix-turn-helix (wHTH) protein